jgi:uncharacterized protein
VKIEFDPVKSGRNVEKHGLPLERFADLDLDAGFFEADTRRVYGEDRYIVVAPLDDRLHVACFCMRGEAFRVISLRKANDREVRRYERVQAEKAAKAATDRPAFDR